MGEQPMMGGNADDAMDRRVVEALERMPAVEIPVEFAARVAGLVPVRNAVTVTPARYGLAAARICMAVLMVAIVVVAMHAVDHTKVGITLEWILCAQLAGLAMWMGDVKALLKD